MGQLGGKVLQMPLGMDLDRVGLGQGPENADQRGEEGGNTDGFMQREDLHQGGAALFGLL